MRPIVILTCERKTKSTPPAVKLGLLQHDWGVVVYMDNGDAKPENGIRILELANDGRMYICRGIVEAGIHEVKHGYAGDVYPLNKENL